VESTPRDVSPDLALRLQHMEQAIDAIAVEIERISEGQRFTTKLLSERGERQPAQIETRPFAQEQTP
jgi:hypothetical protein